MVSTSLTMARFPIGLPSKFGNKHIYKLLGSFSGEAGKKYTVEVKITKDGTPLNVANPHLIVIQHRKFW